MLISTERELMYGGAARGGKTESLLMAALQYVEEPGYNALILRRTYTDLSLPDAVMDRARVWLSETDAIWTAQDKRWTFPSGATLTFGYCDNDADVYRYQGARLHYVGFDELTQFSERQFTYLFSRLDRDAGDWVPLRMRAATNPGGTGHEWVKARYISPSPEDMRRNSRKFIPARLDDNPHVDQAEYEKNLMRLDAVTHAQLRYGDWDVALVGEIFTRDKVRFIDRQKAPDIRHMKSVRRWDLAATKSTAKTQDFSVGLRYGEWRGEYFVIDVVRARDNPPAVERLVKQTAEMDGVNVAIRMEQEPGSSGKIAIDHYARNVLPGYDFKGVTSTGDKVHRAKPVASAVDNGLVHVFRAPWNADFLNELAAFPNGSHDDIVDALSGAHSDLTGQKVCNPDRFNMIQTRKVDR